MKKNISLTFSENIFKVICEKAKREDCSNAQYCKNCVMKDINNEVKN